MLTGVPAGWSLTAGLRNEDGSWTLEPADLPRASVRVVVEDERENPASSATLTIDVIAVVGHDGTLAKETRTLTLPPEEADIAASSVDDQSGEGGASLFTEDEVGKVATADAVLIRGVPEGATLSAGAYDPKIRGWVLRPALLRDLVIEGIDDQTEAFEIELTAVCLDEEGGSYTEVVVNKSVQPAGSSPKSDG
jgi:hypothetical protein